MNKDTILGIIRHILTFGGGFIVAKNIADPASVESITGALLTIIGSIWSIMDKKKATPTV